MTWAQYNVVTFHQSLNSFFFILLQRSQIILYSSPLPYEFLAIDYWVLSYWSKSFYFFLSLSCFLAFSLSHTLALSFSLSLSLKDKIIFFIYIVNESCQLWSQEKTYI